MNYGCKISCNMEESYVNAPSNWFSGMISDKCIRPASQFIPSMASVFIVILMLDAFVVGVKSTGECVVAVEL